MKPQRDTSPYLWTLRGENMTRIETFCAAAFAFAVTMVVISVGEIPHTVDDLVQATRQIPAFAASFAVITWIWHTHAVWSRRFGLEDSYSVFISCVLVLLVLIYMYPLRIMMQGLFFVISDGFFPSMIKIESEWQVRFMFSLYGVGFLLLSITFVLLYQHGIKATLTPPLSEFERYQAVGEVQGWLATGLVCVLAIGLAVFIPLKLIGLSGFIYFLLFPIWFGLGYWRGRHWKKQTNSQ